MFPTLRKYPLLTLFALVLFCVSNPYNTLFFYTCMQYTRLHWALDKELASLVPRPLSATVSTFGMVAFPRHRVYLSHKYGFNAEKHVLHLHSGQSDHSVSAVAGNCLDNYTCSSSTFSFTISCWPAMYTLLSDVPWQHSSLIDEASPAQSRRTDIFNKRFNKRSNHNNFTHLQFRPHS